MVTCQCWRILQLGKNKTTKTRGTKATYIPVLRGFTLATRSFLFVSHSSTSSRAGRRTDCSQTKTARFSAWHSLHDLRYKGNSVILVSKRSIDSCLAKILEHLFCHLISCCFKHGEISKYKLPLSFTFSTIPLSVFRFNIFILWRTWWFLLLLDFAQA